MSSKDPVISRIDIVPDYATGFLFHWKLIGGFNDPLPWKFKVQAALSQNGPWKDISPEIENRFAWKSEGPIRVNKSDVIFIRVVLTTPSGNYESEVKTPYGDLSRSEFLIGKEIIRKEVLHMSKMAGVECDIWSISNYGTKCPHCIDPITGHSRYNNCRYCLGTGFYPPYLGPTRAWCSFSEDNQHQLQEGPEGNGTVETKKFSIRMVSALPVKKNDIVCDLRSGKRYYVSQVQIVAELRRVPLVQNLVVDEIATTDPAYKVGVAE
jgi:hypothetical protein